MELGAHAQFLLIFMELSARILPNDRLAHCIRNPGSTTGDGSLIINHGVLTESSCPADK